MSQRCEVGIVGAGIIGLTSALALSRAGYRVGIVARNLPGDLSTEWASPWAGAALLPLETDDVDDIRMQLACWRQFWAIAQEYPESGALVGLMPSSYESKTSLVSRVLNPSSKKVKATEYWETPDARSNPWYATVMPDFRPVPAHELPAHTIGGNTFTTVTVNPDKFLPWLQTHLANHYGVTVRHASVRSLDEARALLACDVLVNASGMGAKALANDPDCVAVRGQTLLVQSSAPTRRMDREIVIKRGTEYTYVIPRVGSGGLVLGGVEDPGNMSTEIDGALREDILRRTNTLTGGNLANLCLSRDVIKDIVGFRPGHKKGRRIAREGNVVHAYGFAGAGYRYSLGAALQVVKLVDEVGVVPRRLGSKL
ncbi:NAD(P)-binding domain protein [Niveomyces insectorum RCEF 264]|uniref:NAD(P)-binding domain protein n=1 Tax=Niveomyces insectorum RCEF 264 TaxID=1081102 RepID=A0A167RWZ8_9HYPO|nr:NAD(P)-binding domain protein [Niveomyces insectorum RCEF 264]